MREIIGLFTHPPVARTATGNATAVDTQPLLEAGAQKEMRAVLDVGTVTGTTPTLDVKLQESDTSGGTYTDIAGATFAQKTAAGNEVISFSARKRWLRAVYTIGGTTPNFTFSCVILGNAKQS